MPDNDIEFVVAAGVGTITIRREHRRNALAPEHFAALASILANAGNDPSVRVLVLTGAGERAFCAGADLSGEAAFFARQLPGGTTGLGDVIRSARQAGVPIIGRINGACYAGGMGLLGLCDIAIASDNATFCLPEIKLGLLPLVVAAVLQDRVPPGQLAELVYSGAPIDAARAVAIGLINKAVPPAGLDAAVAALAESLAAHPAEALRAGRGLLAELRELSFEARLALAERRSNELAQQPEAQALLAAARPRGVPSPS